MNIKTLYSAEQIQESVKKTAAEIIQYYGEEEQVIALCLLNGAIRFAADLLRNLPPNFELQTIRLSGYKGTESTGASKVAAAVAIQKNGCRKVEYQVDFCALHCENFFLVGYGLDYNGKYRNLPYIGYIER